MIRIEDLKEGMVLRLTGKSQHGKNRIAQHGRDWKIKAIGTPHGGDTLRLESLLANFKVNGFAVEDCRVIKVMNDQNFTIVEVL